MTAGFPARTLPRPRPGRGAAVLVLLALLGAGVWAVADLRLNLATLIDSAGNAVDFLARAVPLDFPPVGELLAMCGRTLAIVVTATALSSLLSAVIAVFAAANTTPGRVARHGSRGLIVAARAVPDVVLAIVFFRVFGFGGLTGVLAMGLHSIGMIGKLYADAVEHVDEGPRAAIRAAGGGRVQELVAGVLPQVLPSFIATSLHRLDINLRVSVVLGFVGVGGIGMEIAHALGELDYRRGMALALVVLALCVVVELLSGALRRALLGGRPRAVPRGPGVSVPWTFARVRAAGYVVLAVALLAASVLGSGMSIGQVARAVTDLGPALALFWPPETGGILGELLAELLVTIKIALAATLLGAVLALPIGALAAENVAPTRAVARVFRGLVLAIRGIPELVLAIIFVVITGLGAVAGALALAVGAVGLLGKLVADSLEEVDRDVEQAVRATGASRVQVFFAATLPQAVPAFLAHVLYQLDTNVRSATLLGLVGAGGIGFYLLNASRVLEFGVVTTVLLMSFGVVLLIELLALWLREALR